MASDSRALTLKLLADTADFQKKLQDGTKDVDSIGERIGDFAKKAAIAFAAAGAAVGAFAVSAVKAAADDEAAQKKLAETIAATTDATAKQIAGVEQYITATSIAIGVTDDELRPAFSRLVRSTEDVEKAQKLLNLALDLSTATGKPLEAVTNALAKAYDGNFTALGRLGLGIDANALKSKDLDKITQDLAATYGSFAENEATTTQAQMERVKIALDEAKESIGAALLPIVQELTAWILENFIPALEAFIAGLTGNGGLDESLTDTQKTAVEWGKKVRGFIDTVIDLKDELLVLAAVLATVFAVNKLTAGVMAAVALIKTLNAAYQALRTSAIGAAIASRFALNPLAGLGTATAIAAAIFAATKMFGNDDIEGVQPNTIAPGGLPFGGSVGGNTGSGSGRTGGGASGGGTGGSIGGGVSGGGTTGGTGTGTGNKPTPTLIEQVTEANFIKNMAPGVFDPGSFRRADEVGNVIINVNSPSIVDREGFSRAVVDALNESNARNGGGGGGLRGTAQIL
jgi:hypothetical protein